MTTVAFNPTKAEAFAERLLDILNSAAVTQWLALRDRYGNVRQ